MVICLSLGWRDISISSRLTQSLAFAACSLSSAQSTRPPSTATDACYAAHAPSALRAPGLPGKTSLLSCSWLHFLKSWSLLKSGAVQPASNTEILTGPSRVSRRSSKTDLRWSRRPTVSSFDMSQISGRRIMVDCGFKSLLVRC